MKLVLASNNRHKIEEIHAILARKVSENIQLLSLEDIGYTEEIEETGDTFEENALIKARAAAKLGYIAMADDSGLAVDALNGAPGVYSARYAGEPSDSQKNNRKLLKELSGIPFEKRTGKFVSVVALVIPQKEECTVRGECPGVILKEQRGEAGFGYDPLFLYEATGRTFAEMTAEEKNRVSHRARSMELFCALLTNKIKEYGLK